MSFFNWFTSTKPAKSAPPSKSSGLGQTDASLPVVPTDKHHIKVSSPAANATANRKIERHERRELLYKVVRDSMIRAEVLAANYKFKVLSLDAHGLQYLVMMDLSKQSASDPVRLSEIESEIARTAKMRHDITVTAVYWRLNEQVTAGLSQTLAAHGAQRSPHPAEQQPSPSEKAGPQITPATPLYEPLQDDEVAAFKQALSKVAPITAPRASGQIVTSGRRNPAPPVEFQDTQMLPTHERASPLSMTQYGDLN